jgi:hypothetical protein
MCALFGARGGGGVASSSSLARWLSITSLSHECAYLLATRHRRDELINAATQHSESRVEVAPVESVDHQLAHFQPRRLRGRATMLVGNIQCLSALCEVRSAHAHTPRTVTT